MVNRRRFIKKSVLGSTLFGPGLLVNGCNSVADRVPVESVTGKALVISTWRNIGANQAAWEVLKAKGMAVDAAEAGAKVPEADIKDTSVGYGGRPDREGKVTLDACIMNSDGDYGAVVFLEDIVHAVSVARMVMEKTPHVMLAGEGARQFALKNGFEAKNLLTEDSEKAWQDWLVESNYAPEINVENHDTIGILTLDHEGNLAGACTTSGLAYKMRGRVGDSPIIGAGLYVDNSVGAATATGLGEKVVKTLGSYYVVERMREGMSPTEACEAAVTMIKDRSPDFKDFQVGFVAVNKKGETGGFSLQPGFGYALNVGDETEYVEPGSLVK